MKSLMKIAFLSLALMIAPLGLTTYAQDVPTATTSDAGSVNSADTINLTDESAVVVSSGADVTSDTTVVVPAGDWLSNILTGSAALIGSLALAAFAWIIRLLPKAASDALRTANVEQIIQRGVDYAINAVSGAAKGKTLTVDVGSEVLAQAMNYIVQQAPGWFLKFVGGEDNLRRMILARLNVTAEASADKLSVQAPPEA